MRSTSSVGNMVASVSQTEERAMTDHRERNMATTRRWFTDGWLGDLTLADETFSDTFATNGIVVGRAGPIRNIENRLAGFPDLTTEIEALLRR